MESSENIHTNYSCTEEKRFYVKRDAFLFDCMCDYFKNNVLGRDGNV